MTRRKREIVGLMNERGLPASGRTRTSDFSHPPCADGSELYSKLLSVVLMKEMAMNGKKEP
jgi:hypothetical protein